MTENRTLILASASPRRRDLLAAAGVAFEIVTPHIDEPPIDETIAPNYIAQDLARFKAETVAEKIAAELGQEFPDRYILGTDTVCSCFGRIYGKAEDEAAAAWMLRDLSRKPHEVITGIAVVTPEGESYTDAVTTRVFMTPMTDEQIAEYIASGEWIGKAGAYAIQETADRYVEKLEGPFDNVVGLPVERTLELLKQCGWKS